MKRILFALLALLCIFSFGVTAFAEGTVNDESAIRDIIKEEIEKAEIEKEPEINDVDLEFAPASFVDNLGTMGLGMLGIFVVMGVVIVITFVLNSVTGRKKKND